MRRPNFFKTLWLISRGPSSSADITLVSSVFFFEGTVIHLEGLNNIRRIYKIRLRIKYNVVN